MANIRLDRYEAEHDVLPPVCMVCGAPATLHKDKKFSWHPPWIVVLVIFGVLGILIMVALILTLTKRMRVSVPLCAAHQNHFLWRALLIWPGFLGYVVLAAAGGIVLGLANGNGIDIEQGPLPYYLVLMLVLFCAWVIGACIVQYTGVRSTEVTDR